LIITDSLGAYGLFPFKSDSLLRDYHLAIIGKPFVPVVARKESLQPGFWYADPATGRAPKHYLSRDHVGYYVNRNLATIRFLRAQPWVGKEKLVLAGHSAGATVMTRLAAQSKDATHLILSGGNPMGRILSIIGQRRAADSTGAATEEIFRYWEGVVAQPDSTSAPGGGDPNKTTFDFSQPVVEDIKKLRIPVLVTYGTRDHCAPYNDYLRVEVIREKKKHVQFRAYPGLEHNYIGYKPDGTLDYDNFNWDRVAADWWQWLQEP
jgi:pimeloyl-ACP methyl ester carboxylesterase